MNCENCGQPIRRTNKTGYCQRNKECRQAYERAHYGWGSGYRKSRVYTASSRYPNQVSADVERQQVEMFRKALAPALARIGGKSCYGE